MCIVEKNIASCSIQVIANGINIDVLILCASDDCNNAGISCGKDLFVWARYVAEKFGFDDFYGGMEPATDVKTQLYSKNGVGLLNSI